LVSPQSFDWFIRIDNQNPNLKVASFISNQSMLRKILLILAIIAGLFAIFGSLRLTPFLGILTVLIGIERLFEERKRR